MINTQTKHVEQRTKRLPNRTGSGPKAGEPMKVEQHKSDMSRRSRGELVYMTEYRKVRQLRQAYSFIL